MLQCELTIPISKQVQIKLHQFSYKTMLNSTNYCIMFEIFYDKFYILWDIRNKWLSHSFFLTRSLTYLFLRRPSLPLYIAQYKFSVNLTCRAFGRIDCELVPSQNDTQKRRHMFSLRPDFFSTITGKFKAVFPAKAFLPCLIIFPYTWRAVNTFNTNCMAILFCDVSSFLRELVMLLSSNFVR
jgi:hypothetical protein